MTKVAYNIKGFLQQEADLMELMDNQNTIGEYRSMDGFVLKNGINFEPAPLPKGIRPGVVKECYRNAANLVLGNPRRFIYCEGYALGVIPVMHAWAIDCDCNVVDSTWVKEPCSLGTEYFGVAIKREYLMSMMRKTETYGVIDQWTHGWPILKDDPKLWRHPIMEQLKSEAA